MKYYEKIEILDKTMAEFSESRKQEAMDLIAEENALYDYFFQNLSSFTWFYPLSELLRFNNQNIQIDENEDFNFWQPLIYLKKVAEQIAANPKGKEDYAKEILKIIDGVVDFSIKRQEDGKTPVNNYHIWWVLTKILHKIPNKIIKVEVDLEKFQKWMDEFANPKLARTQAMSDVSDIIRLWIPKFLNNDMTDYGAIVIHALTLIEPAEEKKTFIGRHETKLTFLDRWRGDELAKHADKIGQVCDETTILYLLDKLRVSLEFHSQEQSRVFKAGDDYYKITLNRVKRVGLSEVEIGFQEGCFAGVVRKYTKEDLKAVKTDDDYMLSREEPTGEEKVFSLLNVKDVKSFKEKFKEVFTEGLLKDLSLDKTDDFDKKVGYLYEAFFTDHSYIWFARLDKPQDCLGSDAHDILSVLCSKVLLSFCRYHLDEDKKLLQELINKDQYKFSIFGRIVLRVIDQLWDQYGGLFNDKIFNQYPDLLEGEKYRQELFDLFKHHAKDFTQEVIDALKAKIKNPPEWCQKKSVEQNGVTIVKQWQYGLIARLKEAQGFQKWYNELHRVFKEDPEEDQRSSGAWDKVVDHAPKNKDEILKMTVVDLVKFMNDFKGVDDVFDQKNGKPSKEGLAREFALAVRENPNKYSKEIHLFKDVEFGYAASLINGFRDAWLANEDVDWEIILDFAGDLIKNRDARDREKKGFDYERSLKGFAEDVSRLIRSGVNDDKRRAFVNDAMYDQAANVFEIIFEKFPIGKQREERRDSSAMSFAINTFIGRVIEDFFFFSMQIKRVSPDHQFVQSWGEQKYNRFFEGIDEGYIYFGRYLPNMCFLDKTWAHKKVEEINGFDVSSQSWKDFMEGYLSGGSVYKDLYELLRPSYEKAIKNKLANDQVDDNLARHITLGYLRDYEVLYEDFDGRNVSDEKGQFELMLKDASTDEKKGRWSEIVQFMWSCTKQDNSNEESETLPDDIKEKMLAFWHWTYEKREFVQKQLGQEEYELFLSRISLLAIILPYVSDSEGKYKTKSWLMESAKYVDKEYHSGFLIEYVLQFTNNDDLINIAEIYKKILETTTPIYKKEDIEMLIDRIHGADKKAAEEIIETYARRGQLFLRNLWEKWNQNKV